MLISPAELSGFKTDSVMQILESKSVFVCEMPLKSGFRLNLYSISSYFVEELIDSKGGVVEVKPVSTSYVAALYCRAFNLADQIL